METVIKKTVSIEYAGKKHAVSDDLTISSLLAQIGLPEDMPVRMIPTKEGFIIIPQTEKN
ncbi:MAG: hypothetical protein KGI05_00215 [Thaumarchaeota archaeon]|nr:hypothetical protein [Nitrososphaerota archaeon]MDE1813061.1 hypothetical protein [Nitrososphaerota archaeon]